MEDKRRSSLEGGSASDGGMSQQSDGSQCDMQAFSSARCSLPQPPHRSASLPECLWYLPAERAQQQKQQQQKDRPQPRRSFSSDEGSDMDADCCGDSGALPIMLWLPCSSFPLLARMPGCAWCCHAEILLVVLCRRDQHQDVCISEQACIDSPEWPLPRFHQGVLPELRARGAHADLRR